MAIYHFSVKAISRKAGRSAVAAAAYRAGEMLIDNRYGKTQDYTKKFGVDIAQIYAPDNTNKKLLHRNELWNTVENVENRKDALLAREFEIAFPSELNQQERKTMLDDLCNMIVKKYNVVVDAAIHAPHTENGSDERNYHAHIMFTTRAIDLETGLFSTKKYRDFSRDKGTQTVQQWRADFATLTNEHLKKAGHNITVDHRSYVTQENDLQATEHEGPDATALRRKHQNDASITLPDICQKNDAIKISNAEKRKTVIELQSLENEIKVSESLIANAKLAYDQANEIAQAEIRANAFQKKYLDFANMISTKKTYSEKLAVIHETQAYELAKQYVLDFELLKSVNKEPVPKKLGFWDKLKGTKEPIFYDIDEVKRNITGQFEAVFAGAKKEAIQRAKVEKQKRLEAFLLKNEYEVEKIVERLRADYSKEFAEKVKITEFGKKVEVILSDEVQELYEFLNIYNERNKAKKEAHQKELDAVKEADQLRQHVKENELKEKEELEARRKRRIQQQQANNNDVEHTAIQQQHVVSANKVTNNKDNDSPTNTPF
ncbi:MobQ family relaxase [Acinetobacter nectaris]|uniref:MobQ family relaxase n=1 Tax=Acinetobacter nectaris TaxID=1219382 RepID=UPI001F3DB66F|nr:MobA/MobL family protein [Acinetobacter nectaris]